MQTPLSAHGANTGDGLDMTCRPWHLGQRCREATKVTASQKLKPGTGDRLAGGGGRNLHPLHQGLGIVEAGRGQMPSQHVKGKVSREK